MKHLRILTAALLVSLIFAGCGAVYGQLSSDQAAVTMEWSSDSYQQNQRADVTIVFHNNADSDLTLLRIGIHFDWMDEGQYFTDDLTNNPATVISAGIYVFPGVAIQIPSNVTAGTHSYTVIFSGTQGSNSFNWTSQPLTLQITGAGSQSASPTSTATGGGNAGLPSLAIIGAVIVVIIFLAIILVLVLMKKRKPSSGQTTSEPAKGTEQPQEKTEKPPGDEYQI